MFERTEQWAGGWRAVKDSHPLLAACPCPCGWAPESLGNCPLPCGICDLCKDLGSSVHEDVHTNCFVYISLCVFDLSEIHVCIYRITTHNNYSGPFDGFFIVLCALDRAFPTSAFFCSLLPPSFEWVFLV